MRLKLNNFTMQQCTTEGRVMETKLEELSENINIESSIRVMTEFFKELRRNCTSEDFRQEISANPKIFYYTLKIISKVSNVSELPVSNKESKKTSVKTPDLVEKLSNDSKMICKNVGSDTDNNTLLKEGEKLLPELSDDIISFLILVMQFLANAVVQSPQSQLALWQYSKDFLGNLMCHQELRLQEVIGAIVYYIFKGCPSIREEIVQNEALMTAGITLLRKGNTEFWYIFFEYLVVESNNFGALFCNLTSDDKLVLIELVENILDADPSECQKINTPISADVITCFIEEFNKNSDLILVTTSKGPKDVNPLEVINLLKILCKVSADPNYMLQVQKNKSLLINCVYLLRALHDASCDPTSNVACVKKVEDAIRERSRLEASSAYGLKADMIRIIGNLMYKNRENQNFVQENKAIEIILESTCYDGLNPFIKEWSILAIKNFCDSNENNQRYIANLKKVDQLSEDLEKGLSSNAGNNTSDLQNAVEFFKRIDSGKKT